MARRFASSQIRADQIERTPGGALRVPAELTRSGVFAYTDAAGAVVREYRPPEEIARADALQTLEDVPVTIGHPAEGVSPQNYQARAVGHIRAGSAEQVKADKRVDVRGTLVVSRRDAIEGVEGKRLVDTSMGYSVRVDPTPGVAPTGEAYDVVQRDIVYNHIALLPRGDGRLGTQLRADGSRVLRLDAFGNEMPFPEKEETEDEDEDEEKDPTKSDEDEDEEKKDPIFDSQMAIHGDAKHARAARASLRNKYGTDMNVKITKSDGSTQTVLKGSAEHIAALESERDAAKARADAADKRQAEADAKAAAERRAALEVSARKVLGAEAKFDGQTDRDIKVAVIKRADSTFDPAGKTDAYVDAAFDLRTAATVAPPARTGLDPVLGSIDATRADSLKKAQDEAAAAAAAVKDAWRRK